MGLIGSRLDSYANQIMFNTDTQLHFRDDLLDQWTTAQAAGQMTAVSQMRTAGGGGVAGAGTPGWSGFPWYQFSVYVERFAVLVVPVCALFAVIIYLTRLERIYLFWVLFIGIFFLSYFFQYHTRAFLGGIMTGRVFMTSVVIAGLVAGFVSFMFYDGPRGGVQDNKAQQLPQGVVVVPSGAPVVF